MVVASGQNSLVTFQNFTGGLVDPSAVSRFELDPDECQDCLNVISTNDGNLVKRFGYTQFNTTAATNGVTSDMTEYLDATLNNKYLIHREDEKMYQMASGATEGTEIQIGGGNAFAGKTVNKLDYAAINDKLYVVVADGDASIVMKELDGTSFANSTLFSGDSHHPRYIINFQNRLVGYNDNAGTKEPSLLMWTDLGAANFDATLSVNLNDNDIGTGLVTIGRGFIAFKENQSYFISEVGTLPYVERINVPVGCISHKTIVKTPDGIIFLSKDGVWHVTNNLKFRRLSRAIDPILRGLTLSELKTAEAVYVDNRYILTYTSSGGSSNDKMLVMDRNVRIRKTHRPEHIHPWWLWNIAASSIAVWTHFDNRIYFGDRVGQIFYYDKDTGGDDSVAIESNWKSGDMSFGQPAINKVWEHYRIDKIMLAGNLTIEWTLDDGYTSDTKLSAAAATGSIFGGVGDGGGQFGTATFGGAIATSDPIPMGFDFVGKHIRIKFSETSTNAAWTVLNHSFEYGFDSLYRS